MPGVNALITHIVAKEAAATAATLVRGEPPLERNTHGEEARGEEAEIEHDDHAGEMLEEGMAIDKVRKMLVEMKRANSHAERGRLFGYVYTVDGEVRGAMQDRKTGAYCESK